MEKPLDLEVPKIITTSWERNAELLTLCQFYPNNPFWVVRPYFVDYQTKLDVRSPTCLIGPTKSQQAITEPIKWLSRTMADPMRGRAAYRYSVNERLSQEGNMRASRPVTHITRLYDQLRWPTSIGLIFEEGIPAIINQTRRIWTPSPFKDESLFIRDWKRYDFKEYVEYHRLR